MAGICERTDVYHTFHFRWTFSILTGLLSLTFQPGGLFFFTVPVFWNKPILFSICMSSACIRDFPRGLISDLSIFGYLIFKISDSSSNLKETDMKKSSRNNSLWFVNWARAQKQSSTGNRFLFLSFSLNVFFRLQGYFLRIIAVSGFC